MKIRAWIILAATAASAPVLAACASTHSMQSTTSESEAARQWRQTCSHCHNLRPAPEFTADQWSVIVMHMRTQAGLTRSEATEIAEYLRSLRERPGTSD